MKAQASLHMHKLTRSLGFLHTQSMDIDGFGPKFRSLTLLDMLEWAFIKVSKSHGLAPIRTASANSAKFRGIRPRVYIKDLL